MKREIFLHCFESSHYDKSGSEHSHPNSWIIEQTVNSGTAGRSGGRRWEGKEGGDDLFKWVHHHRACHVEPHPGLQNVVLYKSSLREGLSLDFCRTLKAHGLCNLLMFSCHKFPNTHPLNEKDLLSNIRKAGRRCECFIQLPDNPCYSVLTSPSPDHQEAQWWTCRKKFFLNTFPPLQAWSRGMPCTFQGVGGLAWEVLAPLEVKSCLRPPPSFLLLFQGLVGQLWGCLGGKPLEDLLISECLLSTC